MGCGSSSNPKQVQPKHDSTDQKSQEDIVRYRRRSSQHMGQNLLHEEFQRSIEQVYDIHSGATLGAGVSGTVRVCRHLQTGKEYALKTLQVDQMKDQNTLAELRQEIALMSQLDHPNIVRLFETFETRERIYLVMEKCTGGELLDRLNAQEGHHYSEQYAAKLVLKMLRALRYCHEHYVAHRDLKLENFIFENPTDESELKLIDFGLSKHFRAKEVMHMPVGTPFYVAPEVLRGNYTQECDLWGIGVITYMLLSGRPPFWGKDDSETLKAVSSGVYKFPQEVFGEVSETAKDFIRHLLELDASKRLTVQQAQDHQWIANALDRDVPDHVKPKISYTTLGNLTNFHTFNKMKKIALEVIAFSLQPEDIQNLRRDFIKMDVEGTGEISVEDLRQVLADSELVTGESIDKIFEDIDQDHTGRIHYMEWLAATMNMALLDEEHLKSCFDRMDIDHSGFITQDNLEDLVGIDMTPEQVTDMIKDVVGEERAAAGDLRIDFDNFCKMMKTAPDRDHSTTNKRATISRQNSMIKLRKSQLGQQSDEMAALAAKHEQRPSGMLDIHASTNEPETAAT